MKDSKFILIFCLFIIVISTVLNTNDVWAQKIKIRLHQPPPNQLNSSHLWKATLTNSTSNPMQIYLEGYADEQNDGRIVEGQTTIFTIQPGQKEYKYQDFKDGFVKWSKKNYEEILMSTGNAPSGTYTICMLAKDENGNIVGLENCITQLIGGEPEKEITLIAPDNGSKITETNPTFIWSPLMQSQKEKLRYDLRIVEILGNQSPEVAIKKNSAFYSQKNILTTQFKYLSSAPAFEKNKTYVWAVTCNNVSSEPGTFKFSILATLDDCACTSIPVTSYIISYNGTNYTMPLNSPLHIQIIPPSYTVHFILPDYTCNSTGTGTCDPVYRTTITNSGNTYQFYTKEFDYSIAPGSYTIFISVKCGESECAGDGNCDPTISNCGGINSDLIPDIMIINICQCGSNYDYSISYKGTNHQILCNPPSNLSLTLIPPDYSISLNIPAYNCNGVGMPCDPEYTINITGSGGYNQTFNYSGYYNINLQTAGLYNIHVVIKCGGNVCIDCNSTLQIQFQECGCGTGTYIYNMTYNSTTQNISNGTSTILTATPSNGIVSFNLPAYICSGSGTNCNIEYITNITGSGSLNQNFNSQIFDFQLSPNLGTYTVNVKIKCGETECINSTSMFTEQCGCGETPYTSYNIKYNNIDYTMTCGSTATIDATTSNPQIYFELPQYICSYNKNCDAMYRTTITGITNVPIQDARNFNLILSPGTYSIKTEIFCGEGTQHCMTCISTLIIKSCRCDDVPEITITVGSAFSQPTSCNNNKYLYNYIIGSQVNFNFGYICFPYSNSATYICNITDLQNNIIYSSNLESFNYSFNNYGKFLIDYKIYCCGNECAHCIDTIYVNQSCNCAAIPKDAGTTCIDIVTVNYGTNQPFTIECNKGNYLENYVLNSNVNLQLGGYACSPNNVTPSYIWEVRKNNGSVIYSGNSPSAGFPTPNFNCSFNEFGQYLIDYKIYCCGIECARCVDTLYIYESCNCPNPSNDDWGSSQLPLMTYIDAATGQQIGPISIANQNVKEGTSITLNINSAYLCNGGNNCATYSWYIDLPGFQTPNFNNQLPVTIPTDVIQFTLPDVSTPTFYRIVVQAMCGGVMCDSIARGFNVIPDCSCNTGDIMWFGSFPGGWVDLVRGCGDNVVLNQSRNLDLRIVPIVSTNNINCNGCSPSYSYKIYKPSNKIGVWDEFISAGPNSQMLNINYTFDHLKKYKVVYTVKCGDIVCKKCELFVNKPSGRENPN